jgi:hypothetical protein
VAASSSAAQHGQRHATLRLANSEKGQTLTARVPLDCSEADFVAVSRQAYALISRLTGCHCASGRVSFVVEDVFAEAIQVDLGPAGAD